MGVTNTKMDYAGECDPTNDGRKATVVDVKEDMVVKSDEPTTPVEDKPDLLKSFLAPKVNVAIKNRKIDDDVVLQWEYVFLPVTGTGIDRIDFVDLKGKPHHVYYRDRKYFDANMQPIEIPEGILPIAQSLVIDIKTRDIVGVIPLQKTPGESE